MNLLQNVASLQPDVGDLLLVHKQHITQDFLDDLKFARSESVQQQCGDYHRVASVPAHVMDSWIAQGRDPWNATPRQIVEWLRKDDLHAFIATDKRV